MAELDEVARGGEGAGAGVGADGAHARAGVEVHHGEGDAPQPRRLELGEMLDPAQDHAVDQRRADRLPAVAARDDDEVGAGLVADLGHAADEVAEDRVVQGLGDPELGRRHQPQRVEPAVAQQPALRVRAVVAELERRRLHPRAHLGPYPLGVGEDVGRRAERHAGGARHVRELRLRHAVHPLFCRGSFESIQTFS